MIEKIIAFFKKLIKIILDMLIPKVNYVTAKGDILVTADHKIFNIKEEV